MHIRDVLLVCCDVPCSNYHSLIYVVTCELIEIIGFCSLDHTAVSDMSARIQPSAFKNAAEGAKLSAANTKFALALYRHQASETTGNIFMSPLSISVALAMTYLGARNNTKSQMSDVLHFGEVEEAELHRAFSDIRLALNKPDQPYKLYMANRLFGEKSYSFLDEFLGASDLHYGAKLEPVDFR